jgi:hypothetical protein
VRWKKLGRRWARVYEELIGHTVTLLIVIFGFWVVGVWGHYWMGSKRLFGVIPWEWLIDAADLYAFVLLAYTGTTQAIRAYRDEP